MKRYYISDIIGDGTEDNPYRAKIADEGVAHASIIPSDPETGRPLNTWALSIVAAQNHDKFKFKGKAGIDQLPDSPMDGKVSAIQGRGQMDDAFSRRGIPSLPGNVDGFRDVIRHVGRQLSVGFNENKLDIADVE